MIVHRSCIYIYLQNNHLDILGFQINDFDTGAVIGVGDTRADCVSSVVVFKLSGTEIDRLGNSFELLSPFDDDGWRVFFIVGCSESISSLVGSVMFASVRWRLLSRVF